MPRIVRPWLRQRTPSESLNCQVSSLGAQLLLSTLLAFPCWPQKNPCRRELSKPLGATALLLIDRIVAGDAESVLKSLAKGGLMVGDSAPTPPAAVKRQFASKEGLFCLFFDSTCVNEPSNRLL
jgi:hypothetical protein